MTFDEWTRKQKAKTQTPEERLQTWGANVGDFSRRLGTHIDGLGEGYRTEYAHQDYQYDAADLLSQAAYFKHRVEQNKDWYDTQFGAGASEQLLNDIGANISYLNNVRSWLKDDSEFWGQFQDENDYNTKKAQWEEIERLDGLDLGAARRQLDDTERLLDEAKQKAQEAAINNVSYPGQGSSAQQAARDAYAQAKAEKDILQEQYDALKRDIAKVEEIATWREYAALLDAPDFAQYSAQGAAVKNPSLEDGERGGPISNIVTYSRDNWVKIAFGEAHNSQMKGRSLYHYMTDDEVGIYNYLLAKNGKVEAQDYLDFLEETLNYRFGTGQGERIRDIDNVVGRTAMTALYGVGAGLDQFSNGIKQLFSSERLPTTATQFGSAYIREDLADTGPEIFGSSLGQLGYDAVTSTANMAPSILVGVLTAGAGVPAAVATGTAALTVGASASGNAYNFALKEGYTKEQARNYAALVGASEAGLQYLLGGISALGGQVTGKVVQTAVQNIDNALLRISAEIGINMAGEGLEEYLQEILDPVFRNIVFHENNKIDLLNEEAAYAFTLGALIAGLLEGGRITVADLKLDKTGAAIKTAGNYETLLENALALDPSSEAYKLANGMRSGALHANDINVGQLFASYAEAGGDLGFMTASTEETAKINPGAREKIREQIAQMPSEDYQIPYIAMPEEAVVGEDGQRVSEKKMPSAIRKYMIKLFRGKVLDIGKDHKVYIDKGGVEEYTFPAKRITDELKAAKMVAGANLDTTLEPARFLKNGFDDGHHPEATGGWDYFYVMFETGAGTYSGIVNTKVTDRGRVFHDITEIQKESGPSTRGVNEETPPPAKTDPLSSGPIIPALGDGVKPGYPQLDSGQPQDPAQQLLALAGQRYNLLQWEQAPQAQLAQGMTQQLGQYFPQMEAIAWNMDPSLQTDGTQSAQLALSPGEWDGAKATYSLDEPEFVPLKAYDGDIKVIDLFSPGQYVVQMERPKLSGVRQHVLDNERTRPDRKGLNLDAAQAIIDSSELALYQSRKKTIKFISKTGYAVINMGKVAVTVVPEKMRNKYKKYLEGK